MGAQASRQPGLPAYLAVNDAVSTQSGLSEQPMPNDAAEVLSPLPNEPRKRGEIHAQFAHTFRGIRVDRVDKHPRATP